MKQPTRYTRYLLSLAQCVVVYNILNVTIYSSSYIRIQNIIFSNNRKMYNKQDGIIYCAFLYPLSWEYNVLCLAFIVHIHK